MNFEPFSPFEHSEPLPPPAPVADLNPPPPAHYFDRVGWVWIVACVLLAGTAGRMLPSLAEPGGLRHAMVALGLASEPAGSTKATTVTSLPLEDAKPNEATRDVPVKQEVGSLVAAAFRQL